MQIKILTLLLLVAVSSCASRKDVLYLQDVETTNNSTIPYQTASIQPNDILKITIGSLEPLAAMPYNKSVIEVTQTQNLELIKLNGYVVSLEQTVNLPILGEISTKNQTTKKLEAFISNKLITEGHLSDAKVSVRLINAKITILGEVNRPGTFNYTDQNMTLLQALGYAGDLTINGKREDILLTREVDGIRKITRIDLTSAEFMNGEYYFIKPNDLIVVNQNDPKVKESGFIANVGTILTIASLALSITILLTR
ncbi:polysaccharide biosynthesis/export family protein [Winogradskyella bathintestinalis]|uniref:Polysaccharide biosynthesis/export family protein n=1 Tax=Winogradskyella bathintestinalis TaxID=3035208 RepID=A0ABT7ZSW3_9FLAO|nr:polysaccharide biosynthesis/export family protein [Winogradskyella bathintestinalis]MDN3492058.1 polysaccharide biosynthesis/export family protein [Winogradskyella bathintestinalis]